MYDRDTFDIFCIQHGIHFTDTPSDKVLLNFVNEAHYFTYDVFRYGNDEDKKEGFRLLKEAIKNNKCFFASEYENDLIIGEEPVYKRLYHIEIL